MCARSGLVSEHDLAGFTRVEKQETMYEGGSISTWPTKEKQKCWKSGDLFFNIVSFYLDTLDPAMLQLL